MMLEAFMGLSLSIDDLPKLFLFGRLLIRSLFNLLRMSLGLEKVLLLCCCPCVTLCLLSRGGNRLPTN